MSENLGRLIAALADRYAIERELGQGGMATVYLARDLKHDRFVALKLLRREFSVAIGPERFLREIRVTARLQHPHILPLLDSGTLEDGPGLLRPYYVMPYVEGESLRDRLVRERQLPVEEAVRIALDVAAALAYAHSQSVLHRDVKPDNILLSDKQPVLADFGLARAVSVAGGERLTETGLALGTPHYMSPEQAAGDPSVNVRSDVYALGCVLYEMLAGDPPFTGPSAQAVVAGHMAEPVPRLRTVRGTVPEGLERVITRALAKAPADRFASAEEFAAALSESTRAPSLPHGRPIGARWRTAAILIGALVAGLAVARFWPPRSGPSISASASLIAVLPFNPSGADTVLSRLGRDLVFTLSAELDPARLARALRALGPRVVVLTGHRASMDTLGRLVYAARRGDRPVEVFDYRGALPDTGASTVARLGSSPLAARDRVLDALAAAERTTTQTGAASAPRSAPRAVTSA